MVSHDELSTKKAYGNDISDQIIVTFNPKRSIISINPDNSSYRI